MNPFKLLTATLVLSGCATNPPAPAPKAAESAAASTLVCTTERPTGSVLPVKVCRTPAEIELKKQQDERNVDKFRRDRATEALAPTSR